MKLSHISLAIFSAIALAACGGSGSSSSVTPGSEDGNGKDKKEDKKTSIVAQELKSTADWGNGNSQVDVATQKKIVLPNGESDYVLQYNGAAYVKNDALLNKDGTFVTAADEEKKVFTKNDKGIFKQVIKTEIDGKQYLFANGTKPADQKVENALSKDKLYQKVNPVAFPAAPDNKKGAFATSFNVYGKSYALTDLKSVPSDASLDGLEKGKLNTGNISTTYTAIAEKLVPNTAGTALEAETNAAGDKTIIKESNVEILNKYKAYKQNYSAAILTTNLKGDAGQPSFATSSDKVQAAVKDDATGFSFFGIPSLVLPTDVEATYNGHIATINNTTADLALNVAFKKNDNYVIKADVTNRKEGDTDLNKDLTSVAKAGDLATDNGVFTIDLVLKKTEKADAGDEYNKLKGQFFGPNAEEAVGAVFKDNDRKGIFAVQK